MYTVQCQVNCTSLFSTKAQHNLNVTVAIDHCLSFFFVTSMYSAIAIPGPTFVFSLV